MANSIAEAAPMREVSDPVWRIITGTGAVARGVFICGSVGSYDPLDPSWNAATNRSVENLFGAGGAVFADLMRQLLGWSAKDAEGGDFRAGAGCESCHYTGYRGRVAVFEILVLTEAVRDAIIARRTSAQIRQISVETSGLVTLLEDGLEKAARGLTTREEVRRTLPRLSPPRPLMELRRLTGNLQ